MIKMGAAILKTIIISPQRNNNISTQIGAKRKNGKGPSST